MNYSIEFPDGSKVEWVDRETLRYSEDPKSVLIWVDFEPGFFSRGRIIKASSIQQWESVDTQEASTITNEKRTDIIEKIKKYYKRFRKPCRVED